MLFLNGKTFKAILSAGAGLLFALLVPAAAGAAANCPPLASKSVTADSLISTGSADPVNVSGTLINFVQGGKGKGCVLVSFSATAGADANSDMLVHAMLDDKTPCPPGTTIFIVAGGSSVVREARAMNYVCPPVAPGKHTIRMQYSSEQGSAGKVQLGVRTTNVQYVP